VKAITSGRVVPSNWWRVEQVLAGVKAAGIREAHEMHDVCEVHRPQQVA
jgi:hypothetical protein